MRQPEVSSTFRRGAWPFELWSELLVGFEPDKAHLFEAA